MAEGRPTRPLSKAAVGSWTVLTQVFQADRQFEDLQRVQTQSEEAPYADDVSKTRLTPVPAQRATFPRLVGLPRIQSRCLHIPDRVSRAYLQVD
jgi:hypothetical protein